MPLITEKNGGRTMIRIGLVDFDTSHVVAFTQRINHVDVGSEDWVEGARVVAGCPGDSKIMPERIGPYAEQLRGYGIELVRRPEDLLGKVDAVMIESVQGARHLEKATPFLRAGMPTYVDKPFAENLRQADAMIRLARAHGAPLMSCSALRYDPEVQRAQELSKHYGRILSADVWTTATLHHGNPGLLHYGIHGVEMLYALMGRGCKAVRCVSVPAYDAAVGVWRDGRIGMLRGIRQGEGGFGFTAHYERGHYAAVIKGAAFYREMLKQVVRMFATRKEPVDLQETREIVAFITAARRSAVAGGALRPL